MAFDSFSAFIAMEGHGPYVWACYAVFAVFLVGLMVWSSRHHQSVMANCKRRYQQQENSPGARPKQAATFARVEVSQE